MRLREDFRNRLRAKTVALLFLWAVLAMPKRAQSQEAQGAPLQGTIKAFVLTATYGVIAGGLTGLASLAFYESASQHTRNIAIGASLGLYTGILLGAYIVYGPGLMGPSEPGPNDPGQQQQRLPPVNPDDPINLGADAEINLIPTLSYIPQQGLNLGVLYRF